MSDTTPKADSDAGKSKCRPWTFWRCFRWTCRILVLLAIGVIITGFFARGWLAERAIEVVERRLQLRGVFFKHGPVTYEINRGLVIEDVVLFEAAEKMKPFLRLSNVGLDFGLSNLLLGEELDVKSVEVSVDRGVLKIYDGDLVAEIRRVQFFGRSKPLWLEIQSAEGVFNGMEVRASGNVHRQKREPESEEDKGTTGEEKKRKFKKPNFAWVREASKLVDFESEKKPPVLKLNVELDKRDDAEEPLRVEAILSGTNIEWKNLPLEELGAEFVVTKSDQLVDIQKASARYRGRNVEGRMRYGIKSKILEIESLETDFDLISLLGEDPIGLGEKVKMVQMTEPPRLFFSGRVPIDDLFSSSILATCEREGSLLIGEGERPLAVNLVSGGVRYGSGAVNSEEFTIGIFGGQAGIAGAVNLVAKPMVYEGGVSVSEVPLRTVLNYFGKEGDWPGTLSGSFAGMGGLSLDTIEGTGDLTLEAEELNLKGPFSLKEAVVATEALRIEYGGGVAAVAGWFDTVASPMAFETAVNMQSMPVQSLLDLAGIEKEIPGNLTAQFRATGANTVESIAGSGEVSFLSEEFEVVGPVALANKIISTEGLAAKYGGGVAIAKGNLNAGVSPPVYEGALDLESMPVQSLLNLAKVEKTMTGILSGRFEGGGSQAVESIAGAGEFQFVDDAYRVEGPYSFQEGVIGSDGLTVQLGGGQIGIQGQANVLVSPKTFEGKLQVEAVSIQSLLDLAGTDKEVEGKVFARFAGSGAESLSSLNGNGAIRIEDGKLYSVPLFGQLKTFLTGVLPTFGKADRSDLEATFTISDGVLNSQDLVASSDMTRVEAKGDLDLGEKTASITALAKVEGVVGVATNVVSRLLELEADGPFDDLDIRLKNNAAGMAVGAVKGTAGAVKGTVGVAKDGVSGLTQGAKNVGGGAVRAGTEGVKKVGKGIGKLIPGFNKKKGESEKDAPVPERPSAELAPADPAKPVEPAPVPQS